MRTHSIGYWRQGEGPKNGSRCKHSHGEDKQQFLRNACKSSNAKDFWEQDWLKEVRKISLQSISSQLVGRDPFGDHISDIYIMIMTVVKLHF